MTRAEVNEIKARMLDEIMLNTVDGLSIDVDKLGNLLENQGYVLQLLAEVMTEQMNMAKEAGY